MANYVTFVNENYNITNGPCLYTRDQLNRKMGVRRRQARSVKKLPAWAVWDGSDSEYELEFEENQSGQSPESLENKAASSKNQVGAGKDGKGAEKESVQGK